MTYLWQFLAIVVFISLSAFFSMSEMVFSSANRLRLENAAEDHVKGAKLALDIQTHFDSTLSAILVGNNLVNIATSSLGSVIAVGLWGEQWTWVMTLILTVTVIIFGETMPKIIAKKNANRLVLMLCYPIRVLSILLKPVTWIVVGLVNLVMLIIPKPRVSRSEDEAQQELQAIIETAEDEKVLAEELSDMLLSALEFDELNVREVMTARVDMEAIDMDDDWETILEIADNSHYSRLPVYRSSTDQIIGVLHLNTLYRSLALEEQVELSALITEPVYLYKTTRLPLAVSILREAHQHLGVVVDEYGGTMGIVTIEDIMEQLVGEIWDENDIVEEEIVERSLGIYELDGDMQTFEFAELMGWQEDDIEAESLTVGGLTTELHGTFPKVGDVIRLRNAEITVLAMEPRRVSRVLVKVTPENGEE